MKLSPPSLRRKGFTLVELLVVISIIVALAGVAFVTAQKAMNTARERQSQKDCADLALAVNNFIMDHQGVLPVDSVVRMDKDKCITTSVEDPSRLITILLDREKGPEMDRVNRTRKKYINGAIVENQKGGIYFGGKDAGLYDPWGHPYYVVLDVDGDEEIQDPMSKKADRPIFSRVIVYGTGPDGEGSQLDHKAKQEEFTADNVYSWKK